MQQPRSGQIKKPSKHQELDGFLSSKPKLFATYIFMIIPLIESVKKKSAKISKSETSAGDRRDSDSISPIHPLAR